MEVLLSVILIFIGLVNAFSIPLLGSSLSIWLTEAGYTKDLIGTFALISLPFSFKILWTPIIDQTTLPFFKNSPRKGWLLFALTGIALSILAISYVNPSLQPWTLVGCLLILVLFASCFYITGIAYELESLRDDQYGMGSFYVITGYRVGLLCAGSGVLYLSSLWDWSLALKCLAMIVCLAMIIVFLRPEPFKSKEILEEKRQRFSKHPSLLQGFWCEVLYLPCRKFFQHSDWRIIFFLLFTFKMGDHMAKIMEGPFYLSLGFNKIELATASKLCGLASTILGSFLAGYFLKGKDPLLALALAGVIHAVTLTCYYLMAIVGKSLLFLYLSTAMEHFTGGMAITIFIFFLWNICDKQYAAVQYALLWSVFLMKADLFAFFGGQLAVQVPWPAYFLTVSIIGISTSVLSFVLMIRYRSYKQQLT